MCGVLEQAFDMEVQSSVVLVKRSTAGCAAAGDGGFGCCWDMKVHFALNTCCTVNLLCIKFCGWMIDN